MLHGGVKKLPEVAHGLEHSIVEFDGPRNEEGRVGRLGRHLERGGRVKLGEMHVSQSRFGSAIKKKGHIYPVTYASAVKSR